MRAPEQENSLPGSYFSLDLSKDNRKSYAYSFENTTCIQGHPCHEVCFSQHCDKPPVVCSQELCECRKEHQNQLLCYWINPRHIYEKIHKKTSMTPGLVEEILSKFDRLIDQISTSKERVMIEADHIALSAQETEFLRILSNGELNSLTGKKLNQVVKQINKEDKEVNKSLNTFRQSLQQEWENIMSSFHKQLRQFQSQILKLPNQSANRGEGSVQSNLMNPTLESQADVIDSKIVRSQEEKKRLIGMYPESRKARGFRLLYRASESNFEIVGFKERCLDIPHTVTLIKLMIAKLLKGTLLQHGLRVKMEAKLMIVERPFYFQSVKMPNSHHIPRETQQFIITINQARNLDAEIQS